MLCWKAAVVSMHRHHFASAGSRLQPCSSLGSYHFGTKSFSCIVFVPTVPHFRVFRL